MKLIVGLGNPGKEYEHTRHNMGFDALDLFSEASHIFAENEKFHGLFGKGLIDGETVFILKPTTFMNNSGEAVREIVNFYKIPVEDILVIYDEMALPVGKIRLRESGSSGGHKGIQSIITNLGTENIKRIRVGIGEPKYNAIDYVLGKPSEEEQTQINIALNNAKKAIIDYLEYDFHHAMSKYN